jgi:surfeit locus 1 family protein
MQTAQPSMEASTSSHFRFPAAATFFNRRWWWTTLLVLAGIALLVRLGFWQLDRREQRRARNADIIAQLALAPVSLSDEELPADLSDLKNRSATARGEYDFSRQVALTNQNWSSTPGFHLITPLVLEDGSGAGAQSPEHSGEGDQRLKAVLVDRGWLPAAQLEQVNWSSYDVAGPVEVTGYIQLSQTPKNADSVGPAPSEALSEWYRVDVAAIGTQLPYELLPVYLQGAPPVNGSTELPFRSELDNDLSEGNHLSYAIQWFIFAAILGMGYVYFVGKKTDDPQVGRT